MASDDGEYGLGERRVTFEDTVKDTFEERSTSFRDTVSSSRSSSAIYDMLEEEARDGNRHRMRSHARGEKRQEAPTHIIRLIKTGSASHAESMGLYHNTQPLQTARPSEFRLLPLPELKAANVSHMLVFGAFHDQEAHEDHIRLRLSRHHDGASQEQFHWIHAHQDNMNGDEFIDLIKKACVHSSQISRPVEEFLSAMAKEKVVRLHDEHFDILPFWRTHTVSSDKAGEHKLLTISAGCFPYVSLTKHVERRSPGPKKYIGAPARKIFEYHYRRQDDSLDRQHQAVRGQLESGDDRMVYVEHIWVFVVNHGMSSEGTFSLDVG